MQKLAIGIPLDWNYVPSDFFDSCIAMNKHNAEIIRCNSGPIHEMRNNIARRALEMDCTHLMFLDADMVYPSNTITQLLEHDLDIVGALTFKRWPDFNPLVFNGKKYKMQQIDPVWVLFGRPFLEHVGGLVQVTATGTGCLMIKTHVFDELEYPWFEFKQREDGSPVGEDINFCYRAQDAGFKVWVDTLLETEHVANTRVNYNMYRLNKKLIEGGIGRFNF